MPYRQSELTGPWIAQRLASFAFETSWKELPTEVRDSVRMRTLDTLGVCLAALSLDTSRRAGDFAVEKGGPPRAHLIGRRAIVSVTGAAFANGVLAHSLDYDDTHLPSILHPSASVLPAALAVAESASSTGAEFLAAAALGLEICVRLGEAGLDPSTNRNIWFDRGQHATSICGTIGASVAAAKLLGLRPDDICNAVAVSASMASGVIEANRSGGTVKRLHCGWAAHSGISAAELVAYGFTGPATIIEGRFGLLRAFLGEKADEAALCRDLGVRWRVPDIFFKPYPANHFTHAVVDAAAELSRRGVRPEAVRSVDVGVPDAIVRTIGEPIELKRAPETTYQAQFSGPYAVAVGLFGGSGLGAALEDYADHLIHDADRRALMAKVDVRADERLDRVYPSQFPAVVTATLRDGRSETVEVLTNLGSPERPLSPEQLTTKFRDNASRCLPAERVDELVAAVFDIDAAPGVGGLLALTAAD